MLYWRTDSERERIVRHFRIATLLQIALLLFLVSPALSQDLVSAADDPASEHVRHLRSRRAAKPMLTTDEDKSEPGERVETKPVAAQAAKPVSAEVAKASAPRQKKAPGKPVVAKQKPAVRKEIVHPAPSIEAPAPASRGLLEDIFGDN